MNFRVFTIFVSHLNILSALSSIVSFAPSKLVLLKLFGRPNFPVYQKIFVKSLKQKYFDLWRKGTNTFSRITTHAHSGVFLRLSRFGRLSFSSFVLRHFLALLWSSTWIELTAKTAFPRCRSRKNLVFYHIKKTAKSAFAVSFVKRNFRLKR